MLSRSKRSMVDAPRKKKPIRTRLRKTLSLPARNDRSSAEDAGSASYTHRTFPAMTTRVCPDLAEGKSCLRIVGGLEKAPPACRYHGHAKETKHLALMSIHNDDGSEGDAHFCHVCRSKN